MTATTKQINTKLGRNYTVIDDDNFIKRHFESSKTYQIKNIQFLRKLQSNYKQIIDVGANWGMNSI